MATFQDYLSVLKSGIYKPIARIDILRQDESVENIIIADIVDGNLNITRTNGTRRSVSLTLQNAQAQYNINQYSPFFINRKFKLWLGLKIDDSSGYDNIYYLPQGIFVIRNPEIQSFNSGSTIRIDGVDKFYNLEEALGTIDGTYIVPVNTDVNDVIRTILNLYVDSPRNQMQIDPQEPILQTLPIGNELTPYTIREETGSTLSSILLKLNGMLARNMYYDVNGKLRFENDRRDYEKGSIWDFSQDSYEYLGSTHQFQYEQLRNKVLVLGTNVNGKVYRGEAVNVSTQSTTSIYRIGTRLEVIEDDVIYSDQLCIERAEYELKRLNTWQSAISIQSPAVLYHLDVDQVITLTDDRLSLDMSRFLINDISIPFTPGSQMSVSAVKTEELAITL